MADETKGAPGSEDRTNQTDPINQGKGVNAPQARDQIAEQMDKFLSFGDLAGEDEALDLDALQRTQNHPFAGYPVRMVRQRIYPINPIIEHLDTAGLAEYCRLHDIIHPTKMFMEKGKDPENQNLIKTRITKVAMKPEEIRKWIEEKETHTFPSYSIVFCEYRRKKSVPHSRAVMSYVNNRFYDVVFDKRWLLPDGKYRRGWFAIVEDHTVRAQLLFRFHPKKRGKLVIDKRYSFLKGDNQQLQPLKEVFLIIQKSRKAIVESGIASSGDKAEDELFGKEAEIGI